MSHFFKISKSGQSIYLVKTLLTKDTISKEEFERRAKKINTEDFLQRIDKEYLHIFEKMIENIKKINEQNFSYIDYTVEKLLDFEREDDLIVFDHKVFATEEEALEYGVRTFGEDYMIEHKHLYKTDVYHIGPIEFINDLQGACDFLEEYYGSIFAKKYKHLLYNKDTKHVFINGEEVHDIDPDMVYNLLLKHKKLSSITNLKDLIKTKEKSNKR